MRKDVLATCSYGFLVTDAAEFETPPNGDDPRVGHRLEQSSEW